jgi:serine/threonine protein kinase
LHRDLSHPNVVELRDVFDDTQYASLVMEYCAGGDLLEIVLGHHRAYGQGFPELAAASLTQQFFGALAYVHKRGIVHRDIKCENVFQVQAVGTVPLERATFKLGDFGLAARINHDEVLLEQVGSPSTSAPEVIHGRPYGQAADMWSAGAVVYTVLAARRPFEASTYAQMVRNASKGKVVLKGGLWDATSAAACNLIESLMQADSAKRPTADGALKSPWLQETAWALPLTGCAVTAAGEVQAMIPFEAIAA